MRILMTGITSIHGWPVFQSLQKLLPADALLGIRPPKTIKPDGVSVRALCVTDANELHAIRNEFNPTHVIHAAGVCDLDVCEDRPAWAQSLNSDSCRIVAEVFGSSSYIMYLSTDLVFSGEDTPENGYCETHLVNPISVAGKTFASGEDYIRTCQNWCIVRLGLPLGKSVTGTKGALDWIDYRLSRGRPVTLFTDEWRSAIACLDISKRIIPLLFNSVPGLFHCGGEKLMSLHDIGRCVVERGGYASDLLKGILRSEEKNGPPRIGRVELNSGKLQRFLNES